ncbi:hypothetical protein B566_EDAN017654 [Ephemera danica]|nr:hypothetical protein B566_EDAN017654 [Ephemera danica]
MTIDEIDDDLHQQGYQPLKVTQLYTSRNSIKTLLPLFLIEFSPNTNPKEIKEIKHICHVIITWDNYRRPKGPTQCMRCQQLGHGTSNCKRIPRCVKCAGQHMTEQCIRDRSTIDPPTCANCGGDHPASYKDRHSTARQQHVICFNQIPLHDGSRGGGVAILVRNNLIAYEINNIKLPSIETGTVQIALSSIKITVVCGYSPPYLHIEKNDLIKIFKSHSHIILAGDFNAKHVSWNCYVNNKSGKTLYDFIQLCNVNMHCPDTFTHFPRSKARPSTLDLTVTKNISLITQPSSLPYLNSDHNPVLFSLTKNALPPPPPPKMNYRKTNWKLFREKLNNVLPKQLIINTPDQLEYSCSQLAQLIKCALDACTPSLPPPHTTDLPQSIKDLIYRKNKIRKQWQQTRLPFFKRQLNQMQKIISEQIIMHNSSLWEKKLNSLQLKDNSIWRIRKALIRTIQHFPPLHTPHGIVFSPKLKANAIAKTLSDITLQNDDLVSLDIIMYMYRRRTNALCMFANWSACDVHQSGRAMATAGLTWAEQIQMEPAGQLKYFR